MAIDETKVTEAPAKQVFQLRGGPGDGRTVNVDPRFLKITLPYLPLGPAVGGFHTAHYVRCEGETSCDFDRTEPPANFDEWYRAKIDSSRARFRVCADLLIKLLSLPAGTRIIGFGEHHCGLDEVQLEVYVEHDGLMRETTRDAEIPLINPQHRRQEPVVFEGWGYEPPAVENQDG